MILEGIVTTLNPDNSINIAPMGPRVIDDLFDRFMLRPYRSSTTYQNLKTTGEGVLHVTDDVLLLARAAIGPVSDAPHRPADVVNGCVLLGACRYYEFRVAALDDRDDRVTIEAETVSVGHLRDFFGFNRAKHAVIEAAILATRIAFLPRPEILSEFDKFAVLVHKTGGPSEHEALELLRDYIQNNGPNL